MTAIGGLPCKTCGPMIQDLQSQNFALKSENEKLRKCRAFSIGNNNEVHLLECENCQSLTQQNLTMREGLEAVKKEYPGWLRSWEVVNKALMLPLLPSLKIQKARDEVIAAAKKEVEAFRNLFNEELIRFPVTKFQKEALDASLDLNDTLSNLKSLEEANG